MIVHDMRKFMALQKAERFVITRVENYHSVPAVNVESERYTLYLRRKGRFYFKNPKRKLSIEEIEYTFFHVGNDYYIFFYTP